MITINPNAYWKKINNRGNRNGSACVQFCGGGLAQMISIKLKKLTYVQITFYVRVYKKIKNIITQMINEWR